MTPLYFDGCFGWYHPPRGGVSRDVAIVLCTTIGYEAICAHRTLRRLADHLAGVGFPVLRFDYHGTGDSDGDDLLPGRVAAWRSSIDHAIDTVRGLSGARAVSLVGLRLGATLAADVAAARGDVASVVLYAACGAGKAFVRETRAFRMLAVEEEGFAPPVEGGDLDAAGFVLSAETVASLDKLRWPSKRPAPRVLVVERDDFPSDTRVLGLLEKSGAEVSVERPAGYAAMMADPHKSEVPLAAFAAIESFLVRTHGEGACAAATSTGAPALETVHGYPEVREQPVRPDERLFGVLTEPRSPGPRARTCVILLNPGSVHHVGSNRMHVAWARRWAADGLRVVRFDLGGIGDSLAAPGRPDNETYSPRAVPDVQLLMRELARTHGIERFVLCGVCSGAYVSFRTALEPGPLAGVIPINPQIFHYREGMSLDVTPGRVLNDTRRYRASLGQLDKWKKLLRGEVHLRALALTVARRVEMSVRARVDALRARLPGAPPGPHQIPAELQRLVDRGLDVFFVYSVDDPGVEYLDLHAARTVEKLRARPNFRVGMVPDADHTFVPLPAQARLEDLLTEHLDRVFP